MDSVYAHDGVWQTNKDVGNGSGNLPLVTLRRNDVVKALREKTGLKLLVQRLQRLELSPE